MRSKSLTVQAEQDNMNNFSKDMLLESQSGFMMPFEAEEGKEIPVTLGYG